MINAETAGCAPSPWSGSVAGETAAPQGRFHFSFLEAAAVSEESIKRGQQSGSETGEARRRRPATLLDNRSAAVSAFAANAMRTGEASPPLLISAAGVLFGHF